MWPGVEIWVLRELLYAYSAGESVMTSRQHIDLQCHDLLPLPPNVQTLPIINIFKKHQNSPAASSKAWRWRRKRSHESTTTRTRYPKFQPDRWNFLLCKFCLVWTLPRNIYGIGRGRAEYPPNFDVMKFGWTFRFFQNHSLLYLSPTWYPDGGTKGI